MICGCDSNWIIASAAVASLVVTVFLWLATNRTANIASETLKLTYEPMLSLEAASLVKIQSGAFVHIDLTNGGGGPAMVRRITSTTIVAGRTATPQSYEYEVTILSKASKKLLIPLWDKNTWDQMTSLMVEFRIAVDVEYEDISRVVHSSHVTSRLDYDSLQFIDEVSHLSSPPPRPPNRGHG